MLKRIWLWWIAPRTPVGIRPVLAAAYLLAGGWMVAKIASYHDRDYGFTYLIDFGEEVLNRYDWRAERDVVVYTHARSPGYDAQYYAQLALDPLLEDPGLRRSVDNLPYRARRILVPWVAHVLGGGRPNLVLNAFALVNLACWLALGVLLLRWFPPTDWDRAFRWAGIMFSSGLCFSVFRALVDGPSLLLLALALKWLEQGYSWRATAVLAVSGLAKETNVVAGGLVGPSQWRSWRDWGRGILRGLLVLLPLVLWLVLLRQYLGPADQVAGDRNFAVPLVAFGQRWKELFTAAFTGAVAPQFYLTSFATLISVTVQAGFILAVWRWSSPAWRLSVSFAMLTLVLGGAVWEGHPGAASRVLLPMLLGFNLLVPRGRKWWALLILGNLTMWFGPGSFPPRPGPGYRVDIADTSSEVNFDGATVDLEFPLPWHPAERGNGYDWRWSGDDADIVLVNRFNLPVSAVVSGVWSAHTPRVASIVREGEVLWSEPLDGEPVKWRLAPIILPPGETRLHIETDQPPAMIGPGDPRTLAIKLSNLSIRGETVPAAND